jgi:hypothetical protein
VLHYRLDAVSEDPQEQVEQTLAMMARYVAEDWDSPEIQKDIRQILSREHQDPASIAQAIFWHARNRLDFETDSKLASPLGSLTSDTIVETLIRPRDMAVLCGAGNCRRAGDCDDHAMYVAALLKAGGIEPKFVTAKADGTDPSRWSHVYVVAYPDGERMAIDASHGEYPGWETQYCFERREWRIFPSWGWTVLVIGALAVMAGWIGKRVIP